MSKSKPPETRDLRASVGRWWWLGVLLLLTATLAWTSTCRKSVTIDEYSYLPNGYALWHAQAFQMDSGTTPLPKLLMSIPTVASGNVECDLSNVGIEKSWRFGRRFYEENADAYHQTFLSARAMSIVVLLATCVLCCIVANRFYGRAGAALATTCAAFSPNLIAHGRLATTDIYFTAAVILTVFAFDVFLKRATWKSAVFLGASLGIATLCKFTGLFLFFLLPAASILIAILLRTKIGDDEKIDLKWRTFYWGVFSIGVAIVVINAGYFFVGSFTPLHQFELETGPFVFIQQLLPGGFPVPLPRDFVEGLDWQMADVEYPSYLMGEFSLDGFWNYYLVAFLVKTPVVWQVLIVAALFCRTKVLHREVPMLVIAVGLFAFFSLLGHKNIGLRYLLFAIPIGCIFIGRISTSSIWETSIHKAKFRAAISACVAGMLVSNVLIWPNYLAYFNAPSGGPSQGHTYLLDSNLDWGQDLILLDEYLRREQIDSVDMAYFGRVPPEAYGIEFRPLVDKPTGRHVVISANLLWGRMYFVGGTDSFWPERDHYKEYRTMKPKVVLGHTLYVFELPD